MTEFLAESGGGERPGDDLSAVDLALLRSLPISVAALASVAEPADGHGSTGEVLAGIRGIVSGAEAAPDNALIAAAFAAYKVDGAGEAELLDLSQSPPSALHDATLDRCRRAAGRFEDHEDWPGVTRWLRDVAAEVVEASAAGGVPGISSLLGIGGERVTQVESELLVDLAAALGVVGR